ncbi:hypothetical protein [Bradyrhizobium sp. 191]|uniref:hypothetical protein n=1 Tax=Bradyrhizobium sp. 191 TaxID=2782659 RepID=UPI001FFEE29C|nr:hypothetical protein [Bradyrhizobium sp. 191]UPJ68337.1 hypothetical protein IVB23_14070 [Bradyrhizobium sp. 191]
MIGVKQADQDQRTQQCHAIGNASIVTAGGGDLPADLRSIRHSKRQNEGREQGENYGLGFGVHHQAAAGKQKRHHGCDEGARMTTNPRNGERGSRA